MSNISRWDLMWYFQCLLGGFWEELFCLESPAAEIQNATCTTIRFSSPWRRFITSIYGSRKNPAQYQEIHYFGCLIDSRCSTVHHFIWFLRMCTVFLNVCNRTLGFSLYIWGPGSRIPVAGHKYTTCEESCISNIIEKIDRKLINLCAVLPILLINFILYVGGGWPAFVEVCSTGCDPQLQIFVAYPVSWNMCNTLFRHINWHVTSWWSSKKDHRDF